MDLLMRIFAIFLLAPALVQGYCYCNGDYDCDCTYLSTYAIVGLVALGVGILGCIGVCIRCAVNKRRQGYLVSSGVASTAVIQTQSNVPYAALANVPMATGPPPPYVQAHVRVPPPVVTQTRILVSM